MMTTLDRCAAKKVYSNPDAALKALQEMKGISRNPNTLTAYRCNCCRKFHLGNNKALA